jgi:hypothetical protein
MISPDRNPKFSEEPFAVKTKNNPARSQLAAVAGIALLTAGLFGCASMEADQARSTEQLLAAAGFKIKLADTPDKLAHLKTLTQNKLVPHDKDGQTMFIYADATTCQCLYIGNQDVYQRYQQLALQKKIADDQRIAAQMNENAAMNWGMWGMGMYGMGPYW